MWKNSSVMANLSGKTAFFPRKDRAHGLKCNAFQTEKALLSDAALNLFCKTVNRASAKRRLQLSPLHSVLLRTQDRPSTCQSRSLSNGLALSKTSLLDSTYLGSNICYVARQQARLAPLVHTGNRHYP